MNKICLKYKQSVYSRRYIIPNEFTVEYQKQNHQTGAFDGSHFGGLIKNQTCNKIINSSFKL